jgi:signal transduction histidine kinase
MISIIISNAIKYTSSGFVKVKAKHITLSKTLVIAISDSGCGI